MFLKERKRCKNITKVEYLNHFLREMGDFSGFLVEKSACIFLNYFVYSYQSVGESAIFVEKSATFSLNWPKFQRREAALWLD